MPEREIKTSDGRPVSVSWWTGSVSVIRANFMDDRGQRVLELKPQDALGLAASLMDSTERLLEARRE